MLDQGLAHRALCSQGFAQPSGSGCVACPAWGLVPTTVPHSGPGCALPAHLQAVGAGRGLCVQFLVSSPASLTARDRAGDTQHLLIGFSYLGSPLSFVCVPLWPGFQTATPASPAHMLCSAL